MTAEPDLTKKRLVRRKLPLNTVMPSRAAQPYDKGRAQRRSAGHSAEAVVDSKGGQCTAWQGYVSLTGLELLEPPRQQPVHPLVRVALP